MSTRDRKGRKPRQDRKEFSRTAYNDPPPRFANRRNLHENYDSNRFSNNYGSSNQGGGESGFSPRKERDRQINYGTRSYSNKMYGNDDQLPQLLAKLENASVERCCRSAQQLLSYMEQAENKTAVMQSMEQLQTVIDQVIISRQDDGLYETLASCIGRLGAVLGGPILNDSLHWYFQWVFVSVNLAMEGRSDKMRSVYLNGFNEALELEGTSVSFAGLIPAAMDNLQQLLEVVETPELLESVVKLLMTISRQHPHCLNQYFKNTVDILVGWHIDTCQEDSLIQFISDALKSMKDYWKMDMSFSLNLLKQFLEDMEAYSNELTSLSGMNESVSLSDEASTPEQCLSKLVALLRAFTTVLSGIGEQFSPSRYPGITSGYINDLLSRVISGVVSANCIQSSEELLIAGNTCLLVMCQGLQAHFAACTEATGGFILQQFGQSDLPSLDHAFSVVKLVLQIVEELQNNLPTAFVQQMLSINGPIASLRHLPNQRLLGQLLKIYQKILSTNNIPLMETVYQIIIADITNATKHLDPAYSDKSPSPERDTAEAENSQHFLTTQESQAAIICDLSLLPNVMAASRSVKGLWQPKPSIYGMLMEQLALLLPTKAAEFPAVHYSFLHALFQDCHSNGHYIAGTTSGRGVSPIGSLTEVLLLLTKQLQLYSLPFDICRLAQRWIDFIVERLVANKDRAFTGEVKKHMDMLVTQLITFTFSRDHSIRLEVVSLLKMIIQSQLISDHVISKHCLPEIVVRLCDTKGEIRAAYSALLEVIPTYIITSYGSGMDTKDFINGRKGLDALRTCRGTWLARKSHMTKVSQCTFHKHHFKAIMGFITHGLTPSKHLPDDWLERMFHSCQHRYTSTSSHDIHDHPENHPMLMSHMACNCDVVLWFWATYESAQYCLLSRLRTPLGGPGETFQNIENVIHGYAQEVEASHDARHHRDTPSSFSGLMGAGLGPRHYTVHLRAILLLQFIEHLDKLMYNAYEGSSVTFPSPPKAIRGFFRMNRGTCQEWLSRIRANLVVMAIHAGLPAAAVRHGYEALILMEHNRRSSVEFWVMLVRVVQALVQLGAWEAIHGISVWCKNRIGLQSWIDAACAQAKGSYEIACDNYLKCLNALHSLDDSSDVSNSTSHAPIIKFIVNQVYECYIHIKDLQEAESWYTKRVVTMKEQVSPSMAKAFTIHHDINNIQALSKFESNDLGQLKEVLERQGDIRRDPDIQPLWDPSQLLNASCMLFLRSVVPWSDGSGSDDNTTVDDSIDHGNKSSSLRRWLKLSSAYAESPLRVGSLEWPLRMSPSHALQLQVAATLRALNTVKPQQQSSSGLLLYSLPTKSLDPRHHEAGVWNDVLRIQTYISNSDQSDESMSQLLLESVRLARLQSNQKRAYTLMWRHILTLIGEPDVTSINQALALQQFNASEKISLLDRLRVQRELAKLHFSTTKLQEAIEMMALSVVTYCKEQDAVGSQCSELAARSLLSLVKWLQTDSRFLQSAWKQSLPSGHYLHSIILQEEECRQQGMGLYKMECDLTSSDLFAPKESRFDRYEFAIGQLLHLATIFSPMLAKSWWSLAGWCYRIGRKNLEALSSTGTTELLDNEKMLVVNAVPKPFSDEDINMLYNVLGQVHVPDNDSDDDLRAKEDVKHDYEEDSNAISKQLLTMCPQLETLPSLEPLLSVWRGVRTRLFIHYQLAARAYFKFLQLSGATLDPSTSLDDMNVTATLRLLRLLVKYAGELKTELEQGFSATPTKPWKGIIPQLFSRLSHPEPNVRQSVSDLLCRVARDSPHYIIYPAIVGASRRNQLQERKSTMPGLLAERHDNSEPTLDNEELLPGTDPFSPPDDPHAEVEQDDDDDAMPTTNMSSLDKSLQVILDSLMQHNPTLVTEVRNLVAELCRVTLLWDEMWLAALMQRQGEVHRRLHQIEVEAKRTLSLNILSRNEKEAILREKYNATMKPLLWVLEHMDYVTSQQPETHNERIFQNTFGETISQALEQLRHPDNYTNPQQAWEPFKEFQQMLMHRSQKRMAGTISLHEVSPHLAAISSSCITMPGLESRGDSPVTLESIDLEVSILPTKTKPKKISMIGSDGHRHTYLFKGLEDLHLDERIMQFMAIINNMFARDNKHGKPVYHARDYAVTPLGARSGLIQWVDSSTPLFGLYKRWQQREAIAMMQPPKQVTGSQPPAPQLPQVLKPNELFYSKIIPLLKEKGLSESTPRKDWPHSIQLQVLEELMAETPNYLLSRELWCASTCASEWWSITQTYCRSTAVMSMIGYIIGLGDRHLDNLLIEFSTGQVVHVDYNVCFEKGRSLRVPEKVPFRMTQNLEHAMGFSGVEGTFRLSCEDIMRILRRGRETLLTLLEAFVYDPLIDWTQSEDAAFPLAVRGPSEGVGLQSRKEMEKEVAESLLVTRLAETYTLWEKSRVSLCAVLQSLEGHLGAIATTTEHLCDHQDQQTRLDQQVDILREALQSPNHPLITMQDRLSDQAKLLMEQKRYTQQLKEQYNEQVMWRERHLSAISKLTADELSKLLEALQQQIDLGPPAYEPSSDFLQSTGQGQTIDNCQQLEAELHKLLTHRRAILTGCLEAIHTYQRITAHLPAIRPSSSTIWSNILATVIDAKHDNNAIISCQEAIKSFQASLKSPPPPKTVIATDARFRKQLQELRNRMSKLNDRYKGLAVNEVGKLETSVTETHANLMKFCRDFGQSGALALSCFVVIAVCPLNRRWLFMEQTAQSAGVRLSELNSREGDWFLDELCTMSGNVSQMINLLENCFEELNQEAVDTMQLAMKAVHTTNKIYSQLQGVVSTFQSIIVPEAVNLVIYEDAEMLQLLEGIKSITVSSQPAISVRNLLDTLSEEYHQAAINRVEVSASAQEILNEIEQQFNDLLAPDPAGEAPSAALMVLSGLNNLFSPVEHATSQLYKLIDKMTISDDWNCVDIIGQAVKLKLLAPGNSYSKELFFIRRIVAVLDFCHELTALQQAMRANPVEREVPANTPSSSPAGTSTSKLYIPSEHHLGLPIRHYISDTVVNQLLGQPSHSLACVLMVAVEALGVNVIKDTPLTLEDACRMAHENNQSSITGSLIQQARTLFSLHDVAWREWDKTKRLHHNMDLCQQSIHRLTLLTRRFQWRYEQLLAQPDANYPWVGSPKSSCLATMKKALSDQLTSNITSTRDKMMSQNFRISQRLQWAAGANSALNSVLDEFQRATNRRAQALSMEEELCDKVVELCSAIVHLEATSLLTATPTTQDKNLIGLLHQYGSIAKELQACMEELSQVSDILPNLELPLDGQPVTTAWMRQRLEDLDSERNKILSEKKMANNNLARSKESALAELDKLRSLNRSYRKLMFDIWMHLTSLAKLEGPPSGGTLEPGPRAFIATQEKFNNDTKGLVQAAQDIIAANMSLAKPTRSSRSTVEQFNQLKETTSSLWSLADWLLSQLSSFTNQLFTNSHECGPLKWTKPPVPTTYLLPKSHSSSSVAAAALQPLPPPTESEQPAAGTAAAASKMYRSVKGVVRDPKTGKALQEQNSYAVGVWRRVKAKLDGRDCIDNPAVRLTVSEQVDKVISEAVNPDNLCELYEGWTPWYPEQDTRVS